MRQRLPPAGWLPYHPPTCWGNGRVRTRALSGATAASAAAATLTLQGCGLDQDAQVLSATLATPVMSWAGCFCIVAMFCAAFGLMAPGPGLIATPGAINSFRFPRSLMEPWVSVTTDGLYVAWSEERCLRIP